MRKWSPVDKHPNVFSYETKKGKRYGVRRSFTNASGTYEEFSRSGFVSWRDAESVLKRFEDDLVNGSITALTGSKIRLGDYFDKMSARKLKYHRWRDSTYDTNKRNFDNHIRPAFGTKRMADIKRNQWQAFLDKLADEGHAASFNRTIHRLMMTTLNAAVNEDVIDKNRLRDMDIHGTNPKPVDISPEQYSLWMDTAERMLARYDLTLFMVLGLGLRRGELMGLRTTSITFKTAKGGRELAALKIDLQRNADYPNGGPLKNEPSYRTIWVDGDIVDNLHFAIKYADNIRMMNGIKPDGKISKPWLWVSRTGAGACYTYLDNKLKDVNTATGLALRPHMFRHYFATEATMKSAPQSEIMHWLGHKNVQMTHDYTRPTEPGMLTVFDSFGGGTQN
jgi:integrase